MQSGNMYGEICSTNDSNRREYRSQINNYSSTSETRKRTNKPKVSRKREMIKTRMEINKIERRKEIEKNQ
jgi:hypothetical protein